MKRILIAAIFGLFTANMAFAADAACDAKAAEKNWQVLPKQVS